ncbi:glutathione S-transferase family protein [Variovorax sp. HJSM1_2]|uniref:glutathione S-transferase family protein n=1 Tax=Variovorax sp. HJSM1_2 TaxID=3366263 RepID=UPI003BBDE6A5
MELHYYPSNASMAPHILLEEIGQPFRLIKVDRTRDAHKTPDYLKLNPNGLIPVLVDGELVLYESAAICLHLADKYPMAELAPGLGTPERAHFYKWLIWMTNTLQATLLLYFYPERWASPDQIQGATALKARAEAKAGSLLAHLEAELARHGGPWLLGAQYTALDAYALMLCRWTRDFGCPARSLPYLGEYLSRLLERPAVQRVFAREELLPPLV